MNTPLELRAYQAPEIVALDEIHRATACPDPDGSGALEPPDICAIIPGICA